MVRQLLEHGADPRESPCAWLLNAVLDDDLEAAEGIIKEYPGLASNPTMFWGKGILALPDQRV